MTNLTLIDETMNIEAGITLYYECPVRGMRPVKVARITKTLIILEDGGRYNRKGYATGDTWKRHVLYIEAKESAEETSKVVAPQKTIEERKALVESRKEQRALAQVAENNAEIAKKLDKLNGFVEQYNATSSQFYKNRIAEQLAWFQRHDISVALDGNGRYALVEEAEEDNAALQTINETIAELRAIIPAERFPEALQMSMKALEMDKGLDAETKAMAYSAYLQALANAVCPPQTTNEIRQCMQRQHGKEAMENALYMYERALSGYSFVELKELAKEQGLDIRGRSKAIYVNALVGKRRLAMVRNPMAKARGL